MRETMSNSLAARSHIRQLIVGGRVCRAYRRLGVREMDVPRLMQLTRPLATSQRDAASCIEQSGGVARLAESLGLGLVSSLWRAALPRR